ncbi:acyltransferase domain-containing protein [Arthrobacter russicus]|uniref:Malonyl CoA-acyl carrier protein transacylase/phosphopantetheinyl transferase/3-hydroxymyristoyl/3-hydroxydecanoyl-(Acyl carrier protein) dehydratase n=1 Tax=Arthrobacter russicus TaxID=172040 RepID=A0ABU1JF58_9MICC|nr:acyltransferase domain-containing protein [Arthrobacter russicus]MDR6271055.1 malonyl CoA-acyl carrier protein transacylase/phosphopantetheinyl transferase/3-hydroxymyristoyl/3-hydroxydecanoyl-(acyl carrier protein) dehydratase [Arthrobacter russicus]
MSTELGNLPRTAAVRSAVEPDAAQVLLLSAGSLPEMQQLLMAEDAELLARIGTPPGDGPVRLGIVAPGKKQLNVARKAVSRGNPWHGRNDVWFRPGPLLRARADSGPGGGGGKLAFVCPGLEADFSPRIDDVIEHFGLPALRGAAGKGDALQGTQLQSSAVLQVSRVLAAALQRIGVIPDELAGHSVGEWSAMIIGGIYDGGAVDRFLDESGMTEIQFPGLAFAVIGTSAETVSAALQGRGDVVLSHDNAPQQSMICGPLQTVEEIVAEFRAQGFISRVLPFASGFHTPMFREHVGQIQALTESWAISPAQRPVWSATTMRPFPADVAQIQEIFIRHLVEHVRFRELIANMHADGSTVFIQLGPGQLGSLISDTLHHTEHVVVSANASHRTGLNQLRSVLTALWACGREVDLGFLGVSSPAAAPVESGAPAESDTPVESAGPPKAPAAAAAGGAASPVDASERAAGFRSGSNLSPLLAAELDAFLTESEALVAALLDGSLARAAALPGALRQIQVPPSVAASLPPAALPAPQLPPEAPGTAGPAEPVADSRPKLPPRALTVSLDRMPYLIDHSFFRQREDWPDVSDRFPVVPGTAIIRFMMDAAEAATGRSAVALHEVRLDRWVDLSEPTDVEIAMDWLDDHRLAVSFGGFAHGTIELAAEYPAPASEVWPVDTSAERPAGISHASQLYSEGWMFHGPQYQIITAVHGVGERHIRASLVAKDAKGSLMDSIGQLAGYWVQLQFSRRSRVFPVGVQTMAFSGPEPLPGEVLECHLKITEFTEDSFAVTGQLVHDGRVWCQITGWQEHRFDNEPNIHDMDEAIEKHTFSLPQPGGWVLLPDFWPDLASRDLTLRKYFGRAERQEHLASPPRGRRQRLLGKIAAKDAIRRVLWSTDPSGVFPAELAIGHLPSGQPTVSGVHGRQLPELEFSIAHSNDVGVAIARPRVPGSAGVGIDVEAIESRPESIEAVLFGDAEQARLDALRKDAEPAEALAWLTRFFSAKEAVGKALGTGLAGRPRELEVVAVHPGTPDCDYRLDVDTAAGRRYRVAVSTIHNLEILTERSYIVAWTTGLDDSERTPQ